MTDTVHGRFTFADFRLQSGAILPEVTIAYVTRGQRAPDGRNAVLVTHGYTSGPRMIESGAGSSEGAWSTLVGPGAPIDTDRTYVVCSNMLGSSYGSTNAASIDPRTATVSSTVIVVCITGMSKWPAVKRPANSLAPVENRKFPATARSSVPERQVRDGEDAGD